MTNPHYVEIGKDNDIGKWYRINHYSTGVGPVEWYDTFEELRRCA